MDPRCESFCARVLTRLTRADRGEKRRIHEELSAHLEDRMEVLTEAGYSPAEAAERAVRDMGDPVEIGDALNAQFSRFWGWVQSLACILVVVLLFPTLFSLGYDLTVVYHSLTNRAAPEQHYSLESKGFVTAEADVRHRFKGVELRVYEVGYDPDSGEVGLSVAAYPVNPFLRELPDYLDMLAFAEEEAEYGGSSSSWNRGFGHRMLRCTPAAPQPDHLTLVYDHYGERFELTVPLDWEVLTQ